MRRFGTNPLIQINAPARACGLVATNDRMVGKQLSSLRGAEVSLL